MERPRQRGRQRAMTPFWKGKTRHAKAKTRAASDTATEGANAKAPKQHVTPLNLAIVGATGALAVWIVVGILETETPQPGTPSPVDRVNVVLEPQEDIDHATVLAQAQAAAQQHYEQQDTGELSFFSPASLVRQQQAIATGPVSTQRLLRDIPLGDLGAAPIVYVAPDEDDTIRISEQIDTLYQRIARLLGSHYEYSLRPAAIESAMEMAAWQLRAGIGANDLSAREMAQQQIAFLSSGRLQALADNLGHRVYQTWEPPESRFVPDGTLISVNLDEDHRIASMAIEHSTGRTAYDESVMNALHQAAPFFEFNELQPWLQETTQTMLFSFGRPPASPEQFRRSQQAPEQVALFEDDDTPRLPSEYLSVDYFDEMLAAIERELTVLNASRWEGQLNADTAIEVSLSLPLGVVMDLQIDKGSGDINFDRLVMRAIDNAAPFRGIRHYPQGEQQTFDQFMIHAHPNGIR